MSSELKPCPHCGGEAELWWRFYRVGPVPICKDCKAESPSIEAWDRRDEPLHPPEVGRLAAAAEDALALLVDIDEGEEIGRAEKIRIEKFGVAVAAVKHALALSESTRPPEVGRLAAAARVLLDRYDAYNFPEDWQELEDALVPFERPAPGAGKNP